MAIETDKYGTVLQAAASALFDLGEDNSRMQQFLHWGLEGARDFHMDLGGSVKTKLIPMTDYNAIQTPKDYIGWTKIGIKCGNIIKTFTKDNNIALHNDCEDGELLANDDCVDHKDADVWGLDTVNQGVYFYGNGSERPIYGLAYKDNGLGYFREHEDKKEIQFRTNLPKNSKILLEYYSDGWEPDQTTLIKPTGFKLVKLYIHWMNLKYKRMAGAKHVALSDVQEAERVYYDEFNRVTWRELDLSLEDIQEAQRQAFMSAIQN